MVIGNANAPSDKNLVPTVVLNPSKDSRIMKEEIFGPILPMVTYQKFDEVINTINAGEKPLTMYYFGKQNSSNYMRL